MAITLVTGQPGHGKTQWAIAQARKLVKEGRTVYAGNIRGLKYDLAGFTKLESFEDWESLPDGSVVLWDECYDALPQRAAGRKVPAHVEALARHRHRGFDFILIAQQPKQLDSFVSGLIERHIHCRRRFGTQSVVLREWDRWERDPDKATPIVRNGWKLDKTIWPLYESATDHTMKRRVPWYVYALPLGILAVVGAFLGVPGLMIGKAASIESELQGGATPSSGASAPMLGGGQPFGRAEVPTLRQTDPLAYMRPRIPAMPWTAPAYDDSPLADPPRYACISTDTTCNCYAIGNGQTIRVHSDGELCRIIASEGIYDPIERRDNTRQQPAVQQQQQPVTVPRQVSAARELRPYIGQPYRSPDPRASM